MAKDRVAIANVPFAIEAGRASAPASSSQLENRVRALEAAATFNPNTPDAGPELVDAGGQ